MCKHDYKVIDKVDSYLRSGLLIKDYVRLEVCTKCAKERARTFVKTERIIL